MARAATAPYSKERADAFAQRMLDVLNGGGLALMLSLGHRVGIFDAMAPLGWATADDIAEAAGATERYVREWLGAMVLGRVVEYESETGRYRLPAEHAAALTRTAPAGNIATFAQFVPLLGEVESRIVRCFRDGGGVGYEYFPRFQNVMAEVSAQTLLSGLHEHVLPLVPDLTARLGAGIDVLEIGFGLGRALERLALEFPRSRLVGYEISREGVDAATRRARDLGLRNVRYELRDVAGMTDAASFDLVLSFDTIHDQVHPERVLANVRRALRPGGTFLMQDIDASSRLEQNFDHPIGPLLFAVSTMHCMTVSLAHGGMGLGAMWGRERALGMLRDAGFGDVRVERLPQDIENCYYVASLAGAAGRAA